jgi:hypothetical protein
MLVRVLQKVLFCGKEFQNLTSSNQHQAVKFIPEKNINNDMVLHLCSGLYI